MAPPIVAQRTLSADLLACLGLEEMTDVRLLGTDGVEIPAFRTVLACRSAVFRRMLCGEFREAASEVISLGYHSDALTAVVEFCITDDVRHFDGRADEAAARGIVQLLACAHFLDMRMLQERACALCTTLLTERKSLACAIFDEASLFGDEPTESIKLDALDIVRRFPEDCLLWKSRILFLGPEALTEVIRDDGMICDEITMFHALNVWSQGESGVDSLHKEGRYGIAKELAASHIRFSSIKPSDLINVVKKSGLVDEGVIFEALQTQALLAERELEEHNFEFSKKRKPPNGIQISSAGTEIINGFYQEDGKYKRRPKYTRQCLWKGAKRTFVIYRHWGGRWAIAIIGEDESIGKSKNDFYHGLDQSSVPINGWEVAPLGEEPCPECQKN